MFKAHTLVYHETLGERVIKKKKNSAPAGPSQERQLPVDATWKREFKLPWREAGPPNHQDDKVDPDQWVVNTELSLSSHASAEAGGLALGLGTTHSHLTGVPRS